MRNRMDAKSGYDIFLSCEVTRSSPVLYRECSIQDEKALLFYASRSQPCSSHFSDFCRAESAIFRALYDACLALLPIFTEESWILEWIRIRVGYVPERGNLFDLNQERMIAHSLLIWIRIRVDVEIFESATGKNLRIKKYPHTNNRSVLEIESAVYVRKEK